MNSRLPRVAHPGFEQTPQLREPLWQCPILQRPGLVERSGLLLDQRQIMQGIADEVAALIGSLMTCDLFFQLVNARYEKGAMILTSNRGFAEWGEIFGDPVVATALLDRLLHHAVVFQIEGSSYRLRQHADLLPEHIRTKANIQPAPIPPTLRRRGRPQKNGGVDLPQG